MLLSDIYCILQLPRPAELQEQEVKSIAADSREIQVGDLFVAIPGGKENGNKYIQQALEKGAIAVITEEEIALDIPILKVNNARRAASLVAASLYPNFPQHIVLVTGTNGKSSVVHFCREIWTLLGKKAASIGTIGKIIGRQQEENNQNLTTPDAITLYKELNELPVDYVAIEASSHGLDQYRLADLPIEAAAFTSLTRDHLDYHHSMEEYFRAKLKLFSEILPNHKNAIIYNQLSSLEEVISICQSRQHNITLYGEEYGDLLLTKWQQDQNGMYIEFTYQGKSYHSHLELFGKFQAYNLLCAIALVSASGLSIEEIMPILPEIRAVPGRMQALRAPAKPLVFIDYAHTPDALLNVIQSIKQQGSLTLVFGCGGERDRGKRKEMGEVAMLADRVIITDDNPRGEDPASIRQEIWQACPKACDIGDRKKAIQMAIQQEKNIVLIAGRGHEKFQLVKGEKIPFLDSEIAAQFLYDPLWRAQELSEVAQQTVTIDALGVEFDSRKLQANELFIALKGSQDDGHNYISQALAKNAIAVVSQAPLGSGRYIKVTDTAEFLTQLALYRRRQSKATIVGVTGSAGKTTTKSAIAHLLSHFGITHASEGGYNNHVGLPISLARMPREAEFAVLEMGMNHGGELRELSKIAEPNIVLINNVEAVHIGNFASEEEIAHAKAEIMEGITKGGIVILNKDNRHFPLLVQLAAANSKVKEIISFGFHPDSDARIVSSYTQGAQTIVEVDILGNRITYALAFTGEHFIINSLAALTVVFAMGVNIEKAAQYMAGFNLLPGRGKVYQLFIKGKNITLIDESYNANPKAMQYALLSLAARPGRKIAVIGDMLELGEKEIEYHQELAKYTKNIDAVFTYGNLMQHLSTSYRHYDKLEKLTEELLGFLQNNDIVLVKASNSMKLSKLVEHLINGC